MSDLRDLYQELILDHTKKPRNFRKIEVCRKQTGTTLSVATSHRLSSLTGNCFN
jgi:NifU-like protein involved in Fe-S cluster formation